MASTNVATPSRIRRQPLKQNGCHGIYRSVNKSGTVYEVRHPATRHYLKAGTTVEEAKAMRDRLRDEYRQTDGGVGNPLTPVGDLVELWREKKAVTVAASSLRQYEKALRLYVLPRWGKVAVRDVTPAAITAWYAKVPVGMRRTVRATFVALLDVAVKDVRAISVNPARAAEMPRVVREVGQAEDKFILSAADLDTLLSRCSKWLRPLVEVGYHQALRLGEIVGLDWSQVDFVGRTLNVDRQRYADGSYGLPKHGMVRRIILTDEARVVLRDLWMKQAQPSSGPVFDVSYRSFEEAFRRAVKNCQFDGQCSPHTLRHSKITEFVSRGFTVEKVSFFARHKNVKVTMQFYIHHRQDETVDDEMRRAA